MMTQSQPAQHTCRHCKTLFFAASSYSSRDFCCAGCEMVFNVIQSRNLNHYYELLNENPPLCPVPANVSTSRYAHFDEPEFQKSFSRDGGKSATFYLEGLNCTACLWLLERLPDYCPAVISARVNMATSTIDVVRAANGSFSEIAQTLNRFGYRPQALRDTEAALKLQRNERRSDLVRIGVAAAATGNIMILAVSLYAGASGELALQFRFLSALLATPVLTYCAWPFYKSAISSLRMTRLNLDVPIVVAILAGIITSGASLISSTDAVYFDSLSMLVFLLLSSRFMLKSIQIQHLQATHLEDELLFSSIVRINSDQSTDVVSSLALKAGDAIEITEGITIPVDGIVKSGFGSISRAVLTGESEPFDVKAPMTIEAGGQVLTGNWVMEVVNPPRQTRLADILRDTALAAQAKSKVSHLADTVSQWFIGLVLLSAAIVVMWFTSANLHEGISRALTLVIVTCPCVFGIAIPLSQSFAIRQAARKGIIIKDANTIENVWNLNTLYFDKTGTLTSGKMIVAAYECSKVQHLQIARSLEHGISHPVAKAIDSRLEQLRIPLLSVQDRQPLNGGGIQGTVDGLNYVLRPLTVAEMQPKHFDQPVNHLMNQQRSELKSSFGLFCEDRSLATFHLSDQARGEAKDVLAWARRLGMKVKMLSGDRYHTVMAIAQALDFRSYDVSAETTPEQKAQMIKSEVATLALPTSKTHTRQKKRVAMIGDGANDASALAHADVGIAMCGSLEVSLGAADVYLTKDNLEAIRELIVICRRAKTAILRNLIFSASFNLVSGVLAVTGLMSPLWAAVLMPMSSVTVLLSAAWSGRK